MEKDNITIVFDNKMYKLYENIYIKIVSSYYNEYNIFYTEYEDSAIRFVRKIKFLGNFLRHILYWLKSALYAIKILIKSKSNNILCINPIVGFFLSLFAINKNIILLGFLFEPKQNKIYYRLRYHLTRFVLKKIKKVIVYSSIEVNYYNNLFNLCNKFYFIQYGKDYINNKNKNYFPDKYISSGGSSNRDYTTLLNAFQNIEDKINEQLCIATIPECINNKYISQKVSILYNITLEDFGAFLNGCDFLVLPLKESNISAGHMVILQALQLNKIILVSEIKGIKDYVNENQVIFFKPSSSDDLENKILDISKNIERYKLKFMKNSKYYYDNFTFEKFFQRIIKESYKIFY